MFCVLSLRIILEAFCIFFRSIVLMAKTAHLLNRSNCYLISVCLGCFHIFHFKNHWKLIFYFKDIQRYAVILGHTMAKSGSLGDSSKGKIKEELIISGYHDCVSRIFWYF